MVFPQPVSPETTTTWCVFTASMTFCRNWCAGSRPRCASTATTLLPPFPARAAASSAARPASHACSQRAAIRSQCDLSLSVKKGTRQTVERQPRGAANVTCSRSIDAAVWAALSRRPSCCCRDLYSARICTTDGHHATQCSGPERPEQRGERDGRAERLGPRALAERPLTL